MRTTLCVVSVLGMVSLIHAGTSKPVEPLDFSGQAVRFGKGNAKDSVVYLEGTKKSEPMAKAMIDQRSKVFAPHVSIVTRGTTVHFPNNDTVFHNVFAYFNAKKFDLGNYPRGASRSVTFDRAGLVAILCNIHSEMSAYIMVVDTPYFAVTDSKGHFNIHNVPPGEYTLHAWHESGYTLQQRITVKEGQTAPTLTLTKK